MKVVAIANQKGGVGKTTTAVNLSTALAMRDQRVLLIDLDPQANASSGLGLDPEEDCSLYGPLLNLSRLEDKIQTTRVENLAVVPAEMDLAGVEIELARMDNEPHASPIRRGRRQLSHHALDDGDARPAG